MLPKPERLPNRFIASPDAHTVGEVWVTGRTKSTVQEALENARNISVSCLVAIEFTIWEVACFAGEFTAEGYGRITFLKKLRQFTVTKEELMEASLERSHE